MASREKFDVDQDDDDEQMDELEAIRQNDRAAKAAARVIEKDDQSKAVDFSKYQVPKNLV